MRYYICRTLNGVKSYMKHDFTFGNTHIVHFDLPKDKTNDCLIKNNSGEYYLINKEDITSGLISFKKAGHDGKEKRTMVIDYIYNTGRWMLSHCELSEMIERCGPNEFYIMVKNSTEIFKIYFPLTHVYDHRYEIYSETYPYISDVGIKLSLTIPDEDEPFCRLEKAFEWYFELHTNNLGVYTAGLISKESALITTDRIICLVYGEKVSFNPNNLKKDTINILYDNKSKSRVTLKYSDILNCAADVYTTMTLNCINPNVIKFLLIHNNTFQIIDHNDLDQDGVFYTFKTIADLIALKIPGLESEKDLFKGV